LKSDGNHLPSSINVIKEDALSVTEDELKGYDGVLLIAGLCNDPMSECFPAQEEYH